MKLSLFVSIATSFSMVTAMSLRAETKVGARNHEVAMAPGKPSTQVSKPLIPDPVADAKVAVEVEKAIKELGPDATRKKIAHVVRFIVRANPDSVLEIVRVAVALAPAAAAPDIIAVAIDELPDPWREVLYRVPTPVQPGATTTLAAAVVAAGTRGEPNGGTYITLVEAIVQTAMHARDDLNLNTIQGAANKASRGHPANALSAIRAALTSGLGAVGQVVIYPDEPYIPVAIASSGGDSAIKVHPHPNPTPPPVSR